MENNENTNTYKISEILYPDFIEQLNNRKVPRYSQDIHDIPSEIIYKDKKLKLSIDFEIENDKKYWYVRYKDETTNDVILESRPSKDIDYAIINMINTISHNFGNITNLDGKRFRVISIGSSTNKREYTLTDKRYKLRTYDPDQLLIPINTCPYCDSSNLKIEYYCSSRESWLALGGREGEYITCQDCGYFMDNCYKIS